MVISIVTDYYSIVKSAGRAMKNSHFVPCVREVTIIYALTETQNGVPKERSSSRVHNTSVSTANRRRVMQAVCSIDVAGVREHSVRTA